MKISRYLVLIVVVFGFTVWNLALANIDNLKGTYSILKDEYKHLSVIHGAIAEQFDYVMNLYDFGCLGEVKPDNIQKDILIPDPKNASAIIKLVYLFFHRPPGTIGRGDFAVIRVLRDDLDKISLAKAFGFIVGFIGADGFRKKIKVGKNDKEIKDIQDLSREQIQAIQEGGTQNHITLFKRLSELDAKSIANLLKPGTKHSTKDLQAQKRALITFLIPTLHALYDDGTLQKKGITPTFPPNTTLNILLAIVFKLFGHERALLKKFYDKVNEVVNKLSDTNSQIFVKKLPDYFVTDNDLLTLSEEWVSQKFYPTKRATYLDEAQKLSNALPDELVQNFETIVYVALVPGDFPRHEGMTTAVYRYDEKDPNKSVSFPDCMDNTFRNMVNVLVYEGDSISLKTSILKKRIENPGILFDAKLEDFYAQFPSATGTGGKAHNSWAKVISNIPGVAYNRHTNNPKDEARLAGCGYIRNVAKIDEAFLGGKKYTVIEDENDILYEIMPSLRNIIVVFNHFFKLNLFDGEDGDTPDQKFARAFIREDFIEFYFPKMCKALKIGIKVAKDAWPGIKIDEVDYQKQPVPTLLKFNQNANRFDVKLITANMTHGELVTLASSDLTKNLIEWIRNKIQDPEFCQKIPVCILSELFHIEYAIFHENWKQYFKKIDSPKYDLLYWLPIGDPDFVKDFINEAVSSKFVFDLNSLKLLKSLINKIPDENIRGYLNIQYGALIVLSDAWIPESGAPGLSESTCNDLIQSAKKVMPTDKYATKCKIELFKALVEKNQAFEAAIKTACLGKLHSDEITLNYAIELFKALFKKNQGFEAAIDVAKRGMLSTDIYTRKYAISLFKALFENNQGFEAAIDAAKNGIQSGENELDSLTLFRALFENNQGFEAAIDVAKDGIQSDNRDTISLFKALFEKNQGFEAAIDAAKTAIQSTDKGIRNNAIVLFKALVGKDRGFEAAIDVAKKGMQFGENQQCSIFLFEALVEKNQGFEAAIDAAKTAMQSTDIYTRKYAISLFEALFKKNQGFEAAIDAAKTAMQSTESQKCSIALFDALVKKNQGFKAAIDAAKTAMQSTDWGTRSDAIQLFEVLVLRDQGFEAAIDAAKKGMQSTENQQCSIFLFKRLVLSGQGFKAAIDAAKTAMQSTDWVTRREAIHLFEALVEKNQGFEAAIDAAKTAMQSTDSFTRMCAGGLFKALVEKNQGFEAAIDSAKIAMQSTDLGTRRYAEWVFEALIKSVKSFITSPDAPQDIETLCRKIIDSSKSIDKSSECGEEVLDFETELPSLLLKQKLIRLKMQLTELKNKLGNLSQKLNSFF